MHSLLIDILPIFWFIIALTGMRLVRPLSGIHSDYLSLDTVRNGKGLFALAILLHHLSQHTVHGLLLRAFSYVGYLCVAVFFFYTGYGLQKSYLTKQECYRKIFLRNRLPKVLIPYCIVTALYWLLNLAKGVHYSLGDLFREILYRGEPIAVYSWYVIVITVFYLVFWLMMTLCGQHHCAMLSLGCIWYCLFTWFCIRMGYGEWWYISTHLLVVGMAWAMYEPQILRFFNSHILPFPAVWGSFLLLFVLKSRLEIWIPLPCTHLLLRCITAVLFVFSVLLFFLKVRIGNPVLNFLGGISFELYLIQGFFMYGLRNGPLHLQNEVLWAFLVVLCTLFSAWLLHTLFSKILHSRK